MMRFDHVLWTVPDLPAAVAEFRDRLGFHLSEEGVHPGRGTRNRCLHFGLSYIELIHVENQEEAQSRWQPMGRDLVASQQGGGGLCTFALAVSDIAEAAARVRAAGVKEGAGPEPVAGSRQRPDGSIVRWTTLPLPPLPSGPSPFLIQWEMDDGERAAYLRRLGFLGSHGPGDLELDHLVLVLADRPALEDHLDYFRRVLGLQSPCGEVEDGLLGARCVDVPLPGGSIRLALPAGDGPAARHLAHRGPSLMAVALRGAARRRWITPTCTAAAHLVLLDTIP